MPRHFRDVVLKGVLLDHALQRGVDLGQFLQRTFCAHPGDRSYNPFRAD